MTDIDNAPDNTDQVAYWNGPAGQKWVTYQGKLDATMEPLAEIVVNSASAGAGERVIDVGCGCGSSSLVLAERVGPGGDVLGIDVSAPMLALARRRAAGRPGLRFIEADASVYDFGEARADVLFSRFGVMFFCDPVQAFTNLRRGLCDQNKGRLAFLCWRALAENDWVLVPLRAALTVVPSPPPAPPEEPGPFAFADPGRIRDILTRAGFRDIEIVPHERQIPLGGGSDFAVAVDFVTTIGPVGRLIRGLEQSVASRVHAAVAAALQAHRRSDGVKLGAAVWSVTARNAT